MHSEVEAFCLVAVGKGILTTDQYAIFEEVCSEDTMVAEAAELLIDCELITDKDSLISLIEEAGVVDLLDEAKKKGPEVQHHKCVNPGPQAPF